MHLLDHPVVAERYFFPRPDRVPSPRWVSVPGAELACHRTAAPADDAPFVLHFHGNGEVAADWLHDFAPALEARGYGVFLGEYRGYGGSTGRPGLHSMLDDALAQLDAVGVPPERVLVYGRSVGSIFALHVAAARPVAGLVLESGIADVGQRLALRLEPEELGTDAAGLAAAIRDDLDHRGKLAAYAGPVLVLHTRNDHMVSVDHAEQLAAWAGDRAELRLFERGDHNSIHAYNGDAILDAVDALGRRVIPR
ncbi:MAG: alpha/beta hydrolase [Sandaracinaceae bacterium]|nr:alpha/beta hydrolase [Sandaracinaceae bacterium]